MINPIERWAEVLEDAKNDLLHEDHCAGDWSAHVIAKRVDAVLAEMRAMTVVEVEPVAWENRWWTENATGPYVEVWTRKDRADAQMEAWHRDFPDERKDQRPLYAQPTDKE